MDLKRNLLHYVEPAEILLGGEDRELTSFNVHLKQADPINVVGGKNAGHRDIRRPVAGQNVMQLPTHYRRRATRLFSRKLASR